MTKKPSYIEKLKNPKWQKKRLEIFQRDSWTCVECGETNRTLHVHHLEYKAGLEPWDYPNNNFQTLCEECHEKRHSIAKVEMDLSKSDLFIEKEKIISESSSTLINDLRIHIDNFIVNKIQPTEQLNFLVAYDNELVKATLFEHFSKEELVLNAYQTMARWHAVFRVTDKLGEQWHSHSAFTELYNKYITEYITNNPFENYILAQVNNTFKNLILRAVKTIADNILHEAQQIQNTDEMMLRANDSITVRRLLVQLNSESLIFV